MVSGIRTVDDELSQAVDHIENEELESALPLLARVVSFQPENEVAYELWIQCHIRLGRMEKALELVDAGLARGLAPAPLHTQKSEILLLTNRFDEAVEVAQMALAIDPAFSYAIRTLALAERARGSDDSAIRIYQEALARIPDDEDLHFTALEFAAELGRHELVIENARRFLRHFGRDSDVLAILGDAYLALRDFRKADRAFRDAAALDPEAVAHHVMILFVALMRGDQTGYDAYAKRLEEDDPELAEVAMQEIALLLEKPEDDEE